MHQHQVHLRGVRLCLTALLSLLLASCASLEGPLASDPVVQPGPTEPLQIETKAGPVLIAVEIADTTPERSQGLMYRKTLAPDSGMLFLFGRDQYLSFWMKNTYVPLDMIFIRSSGEIVAIAADTTPLSLKPVDPDVRAAAVLEVNAGTAAARGIAIGDRVAHPALTSKSR